MMMNPAVGILVVENSEDDALLMVRVIERSGISVRWRRVETEQGMRAALGNDSWDLVLADHSLPHFSSIEALLILQEMELDLPLIVVSATIPEDVAVEVMKAGARDYVLKSRLARLVPVVRRELKEAEGRRSHRRTQSRLAQLREQLLLAISASGLATWSWDVQENRVLWDENAHRLFGMRQGRFGGTYEAFLECIVPEDRARAEEVIRTAVETGTEYVTEIRIRWPNGSEHVIAARGKAFRDAGGRPSRFLGVCWDITARKKTEADLLASKARLAGILELAPNAIVSFDENNRILLFNRGAERTFGYDSAEILGQPFLKLLPPSMHEAFRVCALSLGGTRDGSRSIECDGARTALRKDGSEFPIEAAISQLSLEEGRIFTVLIRDISQQRHLEAQLLHSQKDEPRTHTLLLGPDGSMRDLGTGVSAIGWTAGRRLIVGSGESGYPWNGLSVVDPETGATRPIYP